MKTQVERCEYLADLCRRVCDRFGAGWSFGEDCGRGADPAGSPLDEVLASADEGQDPWSRSVRSRLRPLTCRQCTFFLLLQAIEKTVPAEDLLDWMERPNLDLVGRTPRACIEADQYEPVFEALWLMDDSCGPTS